MNFITLTSSEGGTIVINVNHIGHIYDGKKFTKIGVTTHRNGGFEVLESVEEILLMLKNS